MSRSGSVFCFCLILYSCVQVELLPVHRQDSWRLLYMITTNYFGDVILQPVSLLKCTLWCIFLSRFSSKQYVDITMSCIHCTCTYMYQCSMQHTCTPVPTCTHTHTQTHTYYMHTHTHVHTCAHTHTHIHIRTRMCTHAYSSYLTVIGVHGQVHPNYCQITILLVVDPLHPL